MKKTIKFLWWSMIFLIIYEIVFALADGWEQFIPEKIYYSRFMESLGWASLFQVPILILWIMLTMIILSIMTAIKNRRNKIQNKSITY